MTSPSPLERLAGPGNVLAKEPPDANELEKSVRDESDHHMTTGPKPPADVTSQRLPIPSAILSASARVKLPLITAESPIGDRTTGAMTTAPSIRIATGLPT